MSPLQLLNSWSTGLVSLSIFTVRWFKWVQRVFDCEVLAVCHLHTHLVRKRSHIKQYTAARFKSFIRHIHNYTEYIQQWNVSQVCSMDSAIIWNTNTREYTLAGDDWDKISGWEISHSSRPSHTPSKFWNMDNPISLFVWPSKVLSRGRGK